MPQAYKNKGPPEGAFENVKAAGDVLMIQQEYKKAIDCFNTALKIKPGDSDCLVARSQCFLQSGDGEKALEDAKEILKIDNKHVNGILQEAEALYQLGNFEFALVDYHKGFKLKPSCDAFRLGIQKAREAIDNSIGESANIKLKNEGDLTLFYEEQKIEEKERQRKLAQLARQEMEALLAERDNSKSTGKKQKKSIMSPDGPSPTPTSGTPQLVGTSPAFPHRYLSTPADGDTGTPSRKDNDKKKLTVPQDKKSVKELLGEIYADKLFLEKLCNETGYVGGKSEIVNEPVNELAENCLRYLDSRTQFWQQQKPMYSRKASKGKEKEKRKKLWYTHGKEWIYKNIEEIDEAQVDGKFDESLKQAKKVLQEVMTWSDDVIPNKPEVVANLHSCIGNSYLEMGEYKKALNHHTKDSQIGNKKDIKEAKSRALDNLGRVYAKMGKFEKAVEKWKDKLPMSKSALESTWLYHEIGRCYLEMGKNKLALDYGEKSFKAAQEAADNVWQLNASMLIAQSQVKLGQNNCALDTFDKALDMAKMQGDKAVETAIRKAIDDVDWKIAGLDTATHPLGQLITGRSS